MGGSAEWGYDDRGVLDNGNNDSEKQKSNHTHGIERNHQKAKKKVSLPTPPLMI